MKPSITASMYFAYGKDALLGWPHRTTFDAILAGDRTSTTRYPCWPGYERWLRAMPGDIVRFYEDRACRGRYVDVLVTATPQKIDLAACSEADLHAWCAAEGWSPKRGRVSGRQYGPGVQIRYRLAASPIGEAPANAAQTAFLDLNELREASARNSLGGQGRASARPPAAPLGAGDGQSAKPALSFSRPTMTRYERFFLLPTTDAADRLAETLRRVDGAQVEVEGVNLYVPDKFTFDHVIYHYKAKRFPMQIGP